MQLPLGYTEKFEITTGQPRNEREEIVGMFLDRLNFYRSSARFPAYTYPRLAKMLKGKTTSELHALFKQCETARSFSAFFHWALKPQKP